MKIRSIVLVCCMALMFLVATPVLANGSQKESDMIALEQADRRKKLRFLKSKQELAYIQEALAALTKKQVRPKE